MALGSGEVIPFSRLAREAFFRDGGGVPPMRRDDRTPRVRGHIGTWARARCDLGGPHHARGECTRAPGVQLRRAMKLEKRTEKVERRRRRRKTKVCAAVVCDELGRKMHFRD